MALQLHFLHFLLIIAFAFAPLATQSFFIGPCKAHSFLHLLAFILTSVALLFDVPLLTFAWLAFCAFSFALFLRRRFAFLLSPNEFAKCVPFVFSIIAATWLVSGANDFQLLGYGKTFSYYASLHGHFLGWMMLAAIAFLANEDTPFRRFFLVAVFVSLGCFLLIAFGIDGAPMIKPVGVFGLTLTLPLSQIFYLRSLKKSQRASKGLVALSLLVFVFTMSLAWANELGLTLGTVLGTRTMVSLHGVANALLVSPVFCLALYLSSLRGQKNAA